MTKKTNNNRDKVNVHESLEVPEKTKVVDVTNTDGATVATDGEKTNVESKTGGSKKKRTVTIKSDAMPKTVKGLKTRKKLLKEKIKKAEKKVKLNKNRVIRLK